MITKMIQFGMGALLISTVHASASRKVSRGDDVNPQYTNESMESMLNTRGISELVEQREQQLEDSFQVSARESMLGDTNAVVKCPTCDGSGLEPLESKHWLVVNAHKAGAPAPKAACPTCKWCPKCRKKPNDNSYSEEAKKKKDFDAKCPDCEVDWVGSRRVTAEVAAEIVKQNEPSVLSKSCTTVRKAVKKNLTKLGKKIRQNCLDYHRAPSDCHRCLDTGKVTTINISKYPSCWMPCPNCFPHPCDTCYGNGAVWTEPWSGSLRKVCSACNGKNSKGKRKVPKKNPGTEDKDGWINL